MTTPHPLMRALLVRVAYADDCPPAESDRILRLYFPKLDREDTLQALRDAKEAHDARNSLLAEQIVQKLIHEQTKEEVT